MVTILALQLRYVYLPTGCGFYHILHVEISVNTCVWCKDFLRDIIFAKNFFYVIQYHYFVPLQSCSSKVCMPFTFPSVALLVQFLPIPELMPFRLTPHFTNLLLPHVESPHSSSGQLRSCMVHALRALRNSRELLVNMMDVFVKEPALDWKVRGEIIVITLNCECACTFLARIN